MATRYEQLGEGAGARAMQCLCTSGFSVAEKKPSILEEPWDIEAKKVGVGGNKKEKQVVVVVSLYALQQICSLFSNSLSLFHIHTCAQTHTHIYFSLSLLSIIICCCQKEKKVVDKNCFFPVLNSCQLKQSQWLGECRISR